LLLLFFQGAALGLTAAATPGPLQTYMINQTLAGGWRRGAVVALAPLIGDTVIVLLTLLLLDQIPAQFLKIISLAGGLFALYMAWNLWKQWQSGTRSSPESQLHPNGVLRRAVLMNLLSPGAYAFWTLVNGPILLAALHQSILHGVAFLLGFYGVFICGMLGIVALFHQARRLGPAVVRGLTLVSILILTSFGVFLIWQGISLFTKG